MPAEQRRQRRSVAALIAGALGAATMCSAVPAGAASLVAGPAPASRADGARAADLRAEAARLVAGIDEEGLRLDQLAAAYDAAVIRHDHLDADLGAVRRRVALDRRRVGATRRVLVEEAVAAYVSGDTPLPVVVPGRAGLDPGLAEAYAEVLGRSEEDTMSAYQSSVSAQQHSEAHLAAAEAAAGAALASLREDRAQASAAEQADRALLAHLHGRLAALVAADQASQAAVAAREERAVLASQGVALPGGHATASVAPGSSPVTPGPGSAPGSQPAPTQTGSGPGSGGPTTTAPPTTAPPTTSPPTTSPPTTSPPTTSPPTTSPPPTSPPGLLPQAPGAAKVLAYARAQLGKPYQWGGAGPNSFDCSGLVMRAWQQAGIDFPHLAQDQYDLTERIPLADLLPGDLVFFGTPDNVYHVGIYIGGGDMIDAPETGQDVSISSIYWPNLLGGGQVTVDS